jgi:CxxC motif-containing protein
VDEEGDLKVSGNECQRGEDYGIKECKAPTRMICSTVAVKGGLYRRCPVKTSEPIPKQLIKKAMEALDGVCLSAPIVLGQTAAADLCGTGIAFVTTRDMREEQDE